MKGEFLKRNENHTLSLPIKITMLVKDSNDGIPLNKFKDICGFNPYDKKHRHYCPVTFVQFEKIKKLFKEDSYWRDGEIPEDFYPNY